jgi:hypothetical protein
MLTFVTGHFRDKQGRTYQLFSERAIDLGNGHYLIRREFDIEVWEVFN